MSYERTFWENGKTPINADNLNNLEEGVSANAEALSAVSENMSALTEEIGTKAEQTDLEAVVKQVTTTQNNINTVAGEVSDLETNVDAMQTEVGTMKEDVIGLKSDVEDLKASSGGEMPTGLLYQSDVVDNLLSTSANLPLSANQGRILKATIDSRLGGVTIRPITEANYNALTTKDTNTLYLVY